MRLLIGSDAPASIGLQADIRAWTHRLLWFAKDGDAIVLMDNPDPVFVEHVTSITGVDHSTLHFYVIPSRWTGGNFDGWSLLNGEFQDAIAAHALNATDVVALWPTPEVAWLVKSLGIEHKLPGAEFWRQGGGILANSKTVFRALAAGARVCVATGGVSRSIEDAFHLSGHLIHDGHMVMVKRSYGGAAAGNEIIATHPVLASQAGHASLELIEASANGLHDYWARRWSWASCDNAHPVVIEEFIPDARTLYAEVLCGEEGGGNAMIGELKFLEGRIAREIFPAQQVPSKILERLRDGAKRLGQAYWAIGYRGYLSLDSVVTPDGCVLFTEANARFTSSTHLYTSIAHAAAQSATGVGRVAVQMTSPASWKVQSLSQLLNALSCHGLLFDPISGRGLMAVTPVIQGTGQLVMAAVAEDEFAAADIFDAACRKLCNPVQSGGILDESTAL